MSWGKLYQKQFDALLPHIEDREVWDLGAGDLTLTRSILLLKPKRMVAIDKERMPNVSGIETMRSSFDNVLEDSLDVAFVSWPSNRYDSGLLRLIKAAKTIIYLGTNTGGSACGFKEFFEETSQRELLVDIPGRDSSLVIVGSRRMVRNPTVEEWIGQQVDAPIYMFGQIKTAPV